MKIAICEDNLDCVTLLEGHIHQFDVENLAVDVYSTGESLVSKYRTAKNIYDVVFMDMEMENLNGIQTANAIRDVDEHVIIVFVTSHTKYMQESFQCLPFRYMLKPVSFDEFEDVFSKIRAKLSKERKTFSFNENKKLVRLYCDDIVYCESQGHCTMIYTYSGVFKVCQSLTEIYNQLDSEILQRVHKSFIVNFRCIRTIAENDIKLYKVDCLIPISRTYKKEVMKKFTDFVEREMSI